MNYLMLKASRSKRVRLFDGVATVTVLPPLGLCEGKAVADRAVWELPLGP